MKCRDSLNCNLNIIENQLMVSTDRQGTVADELMEAGAL